MKVKISSYLKFSNPYRQVMICLGIILFLTISCKSEQYTYYNVRSFGATGSGNIYDTEYIQHAIDSLSEKGGGTLYFPPGTYLIKTIRLKDNITINLDRGARIIGGPDISANNPYLELLQKREGRPFQLALILALGAKNIGITGNGIIDGQGYTKYYPPDKGLQRPSIIRFKDCQNILIENISLINSASWVQHYIACDDLTIRGISVSSYSNKNNDGIDIDDCHRVIISQCRVDSEDDSIVLKSFSKRGCKDIVISDCIISGLKSAIKTGTESLGNFTNISISNCAIYGTRGISLLSVDGGTINNVTISNISMRDSYAVIVMRLGERMRPYAVPETERPFSPGKFNNIMLSNIQAVGVTESNDFISGIPGHYIENVLLSNIRIHYKGGGNLSDSDRSVPEKSGEYPKAKMFGILPSYGFFIRHAKHITLKDIRLYTETSDARSVIYCDDVSDLKIQGLEACSNPESAPFLWFKNVGNTRISDSHPTGTVNTFMKIEGHDSKNIQIINIDFSGIARPVQLSDEVRNLDMKDIIR